jgi:hypothetical protein
MQIGHIAKRLVLPSFDSLVTFCHHSQRAITDGYPSFQSQEFIYLFRLDKLIKKIGID